MRGVHEAFFARDLQRNSDKMVGVAGIEPTKARVKVTRLLSNLGLGKIGQSLLAPTITGKQFD